MRNVEVQEGTREGIRREVCGAANVDAKKTKVKIRNVLIWRAQKNMRRTETHSDESGIRHLLNVQTEEL